MKLRYNARKRQWEACFVQCGNPARWPQWEEYDRMDALYRLELGYDFEFYID